MYSFPLADNEEIIKKSHASLHLEDSAFTGAFYLTSERLVFVGYVMDITREAYRRNPPGARQRNPRRKNLLHHPQRPEYFQHPWEIAKNNRRSRKPQSLARSHQTATAKNLKTLDSRFGEQSSGIAFSFYRAVLPGGRMSANRDTYNNSEGK